MSPRPASDRRRWEEYIRGQFQGSHPLGTLETGWRFSLPLYARILREAPPPARVLEVGTGSGLHTLWLALRGYEVTGVDNSEQIVGFARELAGRLEIQARFELADAFDLASLRGSADVVFSTGMIEHWGPEAIVATLQEQASCAPLVFATIPTRHTRLTGKVTDERFYRPRQLRRFFAEAGLTSARTFGYGKVPTPAREWAHRLVPPLLMQRLMDRGRLAMALACYGRR